MGSSGVSAQRASSAPTVTELGQNYPNPFNQATTISFSLLHREHVTLKVFNALGQSVKVLVDSEIDAGEHIVLFEADSLPSGLYFYRIKTKFLSQIRKALLLR
jgi:hypothetical protein